MIKKTINFVNFDGQNDSVDAYFNLSKTECIDLNLEYEEDGGLIEYLKKVLLEKEEGQIRQKPAVDFVKLMVERSYGIRPADDPTLFLKVDEKGRRYIDRFKQSAAYDAFIFALLSGEESLDDFATHVLPAMSDEQKQEANKLLEKEGLSNIVPAYK